MDSIARIYGARAKVAEIPPGPPVLSTLVAEIYAPTDSLRVVAAEQVKQIMATTPGVVDVDWSIDAPGAQRRCRVDRVRAAQDGASVEQIARTLALALNGMPVTGAMAEQAREGVPITPRLAARDRSSESALLGMPVATAFGPRPLARYVSVDSMTIESTRMRRDLRPVVYVKGQIGTASLGSEFRSPHGDSPETTQFQCCDRLCVVRFEEAPFLFGGARRGPEHDRDVFTRRQLG